MSKSVTQGNLCDAYLSTVRSSQCSVRRIQAHGLEEICDGDIEMFLETALQPSNADPGVTTEVFQVYGFMKVRFDVCFCTPGNPNAVFGLAWG